MAGKSAFMLELVRHRAIVYDTTFKRVIYAIPHNSAHLHQDFLKNMKDACPELEVIEGLPDLTALHVTEDTTPKLMLIDDLMVEVLGSKDMLDLVCRDSHHTNTSVCISVQNIFHTSPHGRTFMRNCSEKVVFFTKTDNLLLSILSRQIFPSHPHFLHNCFEWIFHNRSPEELKYLLIDSSPLSPLPYNAVVRSCIFPKKEGDAKSIRPLFFFPKDRE
jgi:hypothetical protein